VKLFEWLTGGDVQYMVRVDCMREDWPTIAVVVALQLGIIVGYLLIAKRWRSYEVDNAEGERDDGADALRDLRNTFVLCVLCGYVSSIVFLWWPAYRLLAFVLVALNYYTWRFFVRSGKLELIYKQRKVLTRVRGERDEAKKELEGALETNGRLAFELEQMESALKEFHEQYPKKPGTAKGLRLLPPSKED